MPTNGPEFPQHAPNFLDQPFHRWHHPLQTKELPLVRITLPKDANIHAREYQLYLPSKQELKRKLIEWAAQREAGDE